MACSRLSPHMPSWGWREEQTAGRSGRPKILQRSSSSSWTHRTPAGLLIPLMTGMPGMGELIEGAMQQAAQCGRQLSGGDGAAMGGLSRPGGAQPLTGQLLKPNTEYSGQLPSSPVASGTRPI